MLIVTPLQHVSLAMRKDDPGQAVETRSIKLPPMQGPGSGRDAWRAIATECLDANAQLFAVLEDQSAVIRDLQREVALLRDEIAARKPAASRERVPDDKVARIEREIREKLPTRHIAKRYGVSAMTVSRIGQRMRARALKSL